MRRRVATTFLIFTFACDGTPRSEAEAPSQLTSGAAEKGRVRFGSPACDRCLAVNCNPYQTIPLWAECVDAKCEESFACFQRNRCALDADTVNQCLCGKGVSNDECLGDGFVARGPCAPMLQVANGSADTRTVFGLMFSSETSVGDGAALFRCGAELCQKECVTDPSLSTN
jgi:hypothetical protein